MINCRHMSPNLSVCRTIMSAERCTSAASDSSQSLSQITTNSTINRVRCKRLLARMLPVEAPSGSRPRPEGSFVPDVGQILVRPVDTQPDPLLQDPDCH